MTGFKSYLWAVVAMLVFAAMLFGLGALAYHAGDSAGQTRERVVWVKKERDQAQAFAKQLDAEVKRAQQASAALNRSLIALNDSYAALEGKYRDVLARVPLLAPAVVRPVRVAGGASSGPPTAAQPASADAGPDDPQRGGVDPDRFRLSLAAVWMWNSSLAGADVPAHTCGSADTSEQACAADSGLSLADAWANHHANAKSCATDRTRFRALIEFLTESPTQ
ncbi:hypothetical protein [Pseudacidovorax intermedius]|uniref:Uncharacterized protein n=1 Tax=Pseudacidovorax intermedius TaxID=433924 RepID=A0A147GWV6_9BURK|nr:hypothetical protein [Pseudacidovorax intermedius]KTT21889.1 hypothetical protein NS331_11035 [Pseudacidovorax intermedius]